MLTYQQHSYLAEVQANADMINLNFKQGLIDADTHAFLLNGIMVQLDEFERGLPPPIVYFCDDFYNDDDLPDVQEEEEEELPHAGFVRDDSQPLSPLAQATAGFEPVYQPSLIPASTVVYPATPSSASLELVAADLLGSSAGVVISGLQARESADDVAELSAVELAGDPDNVDAVRRATLSTKALFGLARLGARDPVSIANQYGRAPVAADGRFSLFDASRQFLSLQVVDWIADLGGSVEVPRADVGQLQTGSPFVIDFSTSDLTPADAVALLRARVGGYRAIHSDKQRGKWPRKFIKPSCI